MHVSRLMHRTVDETIQTNKMQSNYFIKIGLPRGLSFWAVPAATRIESNFTKKRPNGALSGTLALSQKSKPFSGHYKSIAYHVKIVSWKLYMLHKNDIVAFYFLDSTAYFNFLLSTEICPGFAMETENWADRSKKSQLQIKIIWIQIKVILLIFKSKISNRL